MLKSVLKIFIWNIFLSQYYVKTLYFSTGIQEKKKQKEKFPPLWAYIQVDETKKSTAMNKIILDGGEAYEESRTEQGGSGLWSDCERAGALI